MGYQVIVRARMVLLTAVFATASASAFGQSGQSLPAAQIQAEAAAQGDQIVKRLSMDEAVQLALEQNLGIQIQRIDPQIQDVGIAQARAFWAPSVNSSVFKGAIDQPASSSISPSYQNGTLSTGLGLNQILPWGATYSATWNNSRVTSTNIFNNFSPQLQSAVQLSYTQSLLRNLSFDQIRQQVALSRKVRDLSDINLRTVVTMTQRQVRDAYWDLSYAINNLAAQRQSLDLAKQSLQDNEKRVQIGTMAPIDIVQAQAEVASNEQNVIVAEAQIRQFEDRLRALIFDPATPNFWTMKLEPSDTAPFEERPIDLESAIHNALDKRTDLASAKNSISQGDVNIRYFRNQILPDVNAQVNYGTIGLGGTQLSAVDPFGLAQGAIPARSVLTDRSFGSVLGDVFQNAYPQWSVGVQFGYPLGSSTAQANLARAKLQYQQAQTQLKNLELQVVTQVRDAARQVQTNAQRVKSARASRALQEKKLEAEEKKMAAGMSSSFFVFQAQRDLSLARTVEIQAIADYNKSMVDFDAVQEISLTAPTGGLTTPGAGAVQTGNNTIIRTGGN